MYGCVYVCVVCDCVSVWLCVCVYVVCDCVSVWVSVCVGVHVYGCVCLWFLIVCLHGCVCL